MKEKNKKILILLFLFFILSYIYILIPKECIKVETEEELLNLRNKKYCVKFEEVVLKEYRNFEKYSYIIIKLGDNTTLKIIFFQPLNLYNVRNVNVEAIWDSQSLIGIKIEPIIK